MTTTTKTTERVIEKRIPCEYSIELLYLLSDGDFADLAQVAASQANAGTPGTLFPNWLEAMCQTAIEQRNTSHLEVGSWELPRGFYCNPQVLADVLFECHAIMDHCGTANSRMLAKEILRDLHACVHFYLTQVRFKSHPGD